jgi:hypothetical protein
VPPSTFSIDAGEQLGYAEGYKFLEHCRSEHSKGSQLAPQSVEGHCGKQISLCYWDHCRKASTLDGYFRRWSASIRVSSRGNTAIPKIVGIRRGDQQKDLRGHKPFRSIGVDTAWVNDLRDASRYPKTMMGIVTRIKREIFPNGRQNWRNASNEARDSACEVALVIGQKLIKLRVV